MADKLEIIKDNNPTVAKKLNMDASAGYRISKYTPAVTNVEECTKDDTGVGAAMAEGNHLIKGNWALLVILARINGSITGFSSNLIDNANLIKIKKSPIRLVIAVTKAELLLDKF